MELTLHGGDRQSGFATQFAGSSTKGNVGSLVQTVGKKVPLELLKYKVFLFFLQSPSRLFLALFYLLVVILKKIII